MSNTRFNTTIGYLSLLPLSSVLIIRADHFTDKELREFKRDWIEAMKKSGPIIILNSEECKSH